MCFFVYLFDYEEMQGLGDEYSFDSRHSWEYTGGQRWRSGGGVDHEMAEMEAQTQVAADRESSAIFMKANRLVSLKVFFLIHLSYCNAFMHYK